MHMNEYQEAAHKTAIYPDVGGSGVIYPALGLAGEAGEVCEKIKKIIRDKNGVIDDEDKRAIIKELGDAMWYISEIATRLGESLLLVAATNLAKLEDRAQRNVLQGSGDSR